MQGSSHSRWGAVVVAWLGLAANAADAAPPRLDSRLADLRAARVTVVAEVPPRAERSFERVLAQVGAERDARYRNLHQLVAPAAALGRLASIQGVRVRPPHEPSPQAAEGMSLAATGSTAWLGMGVHGAGAKVAVIDRGFWHWQDRVSEGDLPRGTALRSYCTDPESETHGSAMGELVHDQAPLAEMLLICIDTDVELGLAKDYAVAQGADVIVSALAFFGTSRGDGSGGPSTPEGIAADATASGVLWVAAAGNQARQHWGGPFTDTDGDHLHEWAPGDEGNLPILDAYQPRCFYLRWDGWPTTTRDLDLLAVRPYDGAVLKSSENPQRLGGLPPTESLCTVSGSNGVEIRVVDRSAQVADNCGKGCTPPSLPAVRIDLDYDSPEYATRAGLEHWTSARSLAEPAGSPSVLTAGAFCVQTGALDPYSSRGPTPDGRIKPDVVAPDGDLVVTSPFHLKGDCGVAGFTGTSAAAATTAGIAANVKSVYPDATPTELKSFLMQRAIDQGAPGPDNDWGAGRLWLRAFSDVAPSADFAGAAEEVFRRGIVKPRAGGALGAADSVTRADMAEYVLRAMGHDDHLPSYQGYYSDLPAGDPRTPWVEHLREHGIADVNAGAFRPDDRITHAEAAGFLARAAPGGELPPQGQPTTPLTRAELVLWLTAAWDMRWFQQLPLGLVNDVVLIGDRVWFTNEGDNTVNSYDFRTGRVEAPIVVGSKPRELDAALDGSKLVVTNPASHDVSVVDTAARKELRRVPVPRGNYGETPYSIAVAANGKALLSTTTYPNYTGFSSHIFELDPETGAVTMRPDLPPGSSGTTTEMTYLSASGDRRRVFAVVGDISSGEVWAYDSATDSRSANGAVGTFEGYVASDREGGTVVVAPTTAYLHGNMTVERNPTMPPTFGVALSPGGTRLFAGRQGGVAFYDGMTDAVLTRRPLGDSIDDALSRNYIFSAVARMAMDPAGRTLAVVTDHGLTLLPTGLGPDEPDAAPSDTVSPAVSIESGPQGTVRETSATFRFGSSEPGSTFQCRLDGGERNGCLSPKTVTDLAPGEHTLAVRAVDGAGNPSAEATRTWTVDPNAPPPDSGSEPGPTPEPDPAPDPALAPDPQPSPTLAESGAGSPTPAIAPLSPSSTRPTTGVRGAAPPAPARPRSVRAPRILAPRARRGVATTWLGQRLRATPGTWTGTGPLRFSFRWQRCTKRAQGWDCRPLAGRARSYVLRQADAGRGLRVAVTARGPGGTAVARSRIFVPALLRRLQPRTHGRHAATQLVVVDHAARD